MTFAGQVVVVTGAGRGIGASIAKRIAEFGGNLVLVSRTKEQLTVVETAIKNSGGNAISVVADISVPSDVTRIFTTTINTYGKITGLVNAAASIKVVNWEDASTDDIRHMWNVNVMGSILCSQEAFKLMKKNGGGAIVNFSSLGGIQSTQKFPGFGPYVTTKFAIVGLTESMAVEGKLHKIRVNCIAPGAVDTQMLKEAAPFLKTSTTPDDIASVATYLLNPNESGILNGSTIEVHSNE